MMAINCVEVDCKDQNRCTCMNIPNAKMAKHFEIPKLMNGLGLAGISYIGSTDRSNSFRIYNNMQSLKYQAYKRGRKKSPYVYIETTPNENNMYDG